MILAGGRRRYTVAVEPISTAVSVERAASLRVLACQIEVPGAVDAPARDRHLKRVVATIGAALDERPADLVVLPELASVPYDSGLGGALPALAESLDGPSRQAFSRLAKRHRTHVLFGFPRRAVDGFRICQAVVGPDGALRGHYDKIHLAQFGASRERDLFVPGRQPLVFDVDGVRVAPIICYDIREPEFARYLCLDRGVHLLAHCGAYYRDESFHSWHAFVTTRALENQFHVLSLNRAGPGFGHSLYCPPWADERTPEQCFGEREELRMIDIGVAAVEHARRDYPFLADRVAAYPTAGDDTA